MKYTWRCQKCQRYLATIETDPTMQVPVVQRTLCPRCKSENKISLNPHVGHCVLSCAFSEKHLSNLQEEKRKEAPNPKIVLVEKLGKEICIDSRIIIKKK